MYQQPEDTRITVSYTFGGDSLYRIGIRGGGKHKVLERISSDGMRLSRGKVINSVSSVKRLLGNARRITIHGQK